MNPPVDVAEEEAAVRALWDEINAAFLAKDWDRYYPLFAEGPGFQMVHPGQRDWLAGSDQFRVSYESLVTAEGQFDFKTNRFDVQIGPRGDVAWAMLESVFSGGGFAETVNWALVVFVKNDDGWKVASALVGEVAS